MKKYEIVLMTSFLWIWIIIVGIEVAIKRGWLAL